MIDRFLNWGDHGKPKSGKIKGLSQHFENVLNLEFTTNSRRRIPVGVIKFKRQINVASSRSSKSGEETERCTSSEASETL